MADYVDADEDRGQDITHYPGDGHPQCVPLVNITVEGKEPKPFTVGDAIKQASAAIVRQPRLSQWREEAEAKNDGHVPDDEYHAAAFLNSLGVDLASEHHRETPRRLAEAMRELTHREEFKFTTFQAKSQNMITLGPIPFYTMCAHHTLPFHGNAWIGYVPEERIAGLSKFARAVGYVAKGFHVQEELTTELHDFLTEKLEPKGLAVVMKAEHMCMAMRGVRASGVITTTSEVSGVFADHNRTAKAEFMEWIRG